MFTLAQPHYGYYNPYEELAMQQELQRRRQIEAYLRRQREAEEVERRRQAYEAAVRAEYERRREAELELRRQAELQRRRQAQGHGRHSMYDGGLGSLFDALYGGQSPRQRPGWEGPRPTFSARNSPTPAGDSTPSSAPVSPPTPTPAQVPAEVSVAVEPEPEPEDEPQMDTAPSYAAVESILASFAALQSEFTFPTQPDFLPDSSKLAYTPHNAPIHGYEHALTGLLTRLDAVESYGDDGVRKARKEAVKTIEKELERLDEMKAEAWKHVTGPQPKANVETVAELADPLAIPLPEDEQMEELEQASEVAVIEELPSIDQRPAVENAPVPVESIFLDQAEPSALPEAERATSLDQPADNVLALAPSTPDTDLALSHDSTLDTPSHHTPNLETLVRSLTSPTPSEESESDSDLELEEYVDVETMSTSEDEHAELEEVEKDEDLELMGDWDLDF